MNDLLQLNRFGFHELKEKPTPEALEQWYAQTYYQDTPDTGYEQVYSAEEQAFIENKIAQKYLVLESLRAGADTVGQRFLDVGCGEGWSLKYFAEKAWTIQGLDYSEFGCRHQNPGCLDRVTTGDVHHNLKILVEKGMQYECIWLDNVLEHVLDPLAILSDIHKLLAPEGVLMIEVPNDCSAVQHHLLDKGIISQSYWIAPFEHISYFNKDGLLALCDEAGLRCEDLMADHAIDLSLFNPRTNFVEDKASGKACHHQRIAIENFLHGISPEKTNALYRAMADMGLGRQVIGFFRKK
ncbi:class I SAM-dependent methyltransferase [Noviherbaspirillum saxi]|uniref:Class I SAM-dependent methyltransferase n=1 Tax=Noviherbaspirillum saxi TaxID=2320863 RepID=A0A3A3GCK8_9BURK|nr:class I SAM-dependent methyltransferase [Noviherbaspirillum saxi]RJF98619.1 class I SAM-dependent methyltransferase [Noviherbaspirillum saxi]